MRYGDVNQSHNRNTYLKISEISKRLMIPYRTVVGFLQRFKSNSANAFIDLRINASLKPAIIGSK